MVLGISSMSWEKPLAANRGPSSCPACAVDAASGQPSAQTPTAHQDYVWLSERSGFLPGSGWNRDSVPCLPQLGYGHAGADGELPPLSRYHL